jgi:hypothetical protein
MTTGKDTNMHITNNKPPRLERMLVSLLAAAATLAMLSSAGTPLVIRKAAKIPDTFAGLEKFLAACDDLQTMSLVAFVAVVPIAVSIGLAMMAFGGKGAVQKVALPAAALLGVMVVPGVIS